MPAPELIKALLINAAATNAAAVCQNTTGGGVPIDPLIQDTSLQGKGVMVYEECKIQYAALLRAFHDRTGIWPDPKVSETPAAPGLGVANLAAFLPQVLAVLGKLPRELPLPATLGGVLDLLGKLGTDAPKQPGAELAK